MKNYDISVIIPIYNAEKYINKCIKSLIDQNYDFRRIEVLLINDGSSDNSLEIITKYAKKYNNIKVFTHENHGVSYTRNVGLTKATGAYIMFLDSDDYLSANAIKTLINFFDENYEKTDIVTYSMCYVKNGKVSEHPKNSIFKKSGVYTTEQTKYYPATTINVVIKNRKKSNILFDETLKVHEDCNFNVKHVMGKHSLGYCKEATYYYTKNDDGAVSNLMNPYYIFNDWIKICEGYIKQYNDNGLNKYVQMIILYEIYYKLAGNNLFPTYMDEKNYQKAFAKIVKIVETIDDDVILGSPNLNKFYKYFLISLKNNNFEVKADKTVQLYSNNKLILTEKDFEVVITRFKVLNNKIYLMGFFKSGLFNFYTPNLYVMEDDNKVKLDLKLSTHSCYKVKTMTNKFYMFDLVYDINDINNLTFKVEVNNKSYPVRYYLMPNVIFNSTLNNREVIVNGNRISIVGSNIEVAKITSNYQKQYEEKVNDKFKKINKKILYFRRLANISKSEIWLYNDRNGLVDNAYYQFKHDILKNDSIKRYYVISDDKTFIKQKFTKNERKHLVRFKSLKHKILYLNASKILSSFKDLEMFCPFPNSIDWYKDILKYELIYLQHGILHCHTPWIYSKEASYIDKIVLSSQFEYNNLIENYNFNQKDFIMSGMPRLDYIDRNKKKTGRILIALSWRINLMGPYKDRKYMADNKKFLASKYYKELEKLISSKQFNSLVKNNHLQVDLMSHPIFRVYDHLLQTNENINLISDANPSDYDLIITDYSSIVFDYVYANVPVIYFVPDYDLYKAGITHIYNKLDLPMEDGFGPFTNSSLELIKELKLFIENGFKLDKKYNKSKNFFIDSSNHCESLYLELIGDKSEK